MSVFEGFPSYCFLESTLPITNFSSYPSGSFTCDCTGTGFIQATCMQVSLSSFVYFLHLEYAFNFDKGICDI